MGQEVIDNTCVRIFFRLFLTDGQIKERSGITFISNEWDWGDLTISIHSASKTGATEPIPTQALSSRTMISTSNGIRTLSAWPLIWAKAVQLN